MEVRGHLHIAAAVPRGVKLTCYLFSIEFHSELHSACPQDAVRFSLYLLLSAAFAARHGGSVLTWYNSFSCHLRLNYPSETSAVPLLIEHLLRQSWSR